MLQTKAKAILWVSFGRNALYELSGRDNIQARQEIQKAGSIYSVRQIGCVSCDGRKHWLRKM